MEGVEGEDPLDAFMATIEKQIVDQQQDATDDFNQGTASSIHEAVTTMVHPSAAQLSIASKVASSRFCDLLDHLRKGSRIHYGQERGDEGDEDTHQAQQRLEMCVRLVVAQPAEFLRRFGHTLTLKQLDSFVPSPDPDVGKHVARLQALMLEQRHRFDPTTIPTSSPTPTPTTTIMRTSNKDYDPGDVHMGIAGEPAGDPAGYPPNRPAEQSSKHFSEQRPSYPPASARARNRRYRRLQQLAQGGVWFSDEAMKERDPWLWHEHVGRLEGGERPAPRAAAEEVPGSTTVRTYLQESLGFLSEQPKDGDWLAGSSSAAGGGIGVGLGGKGPSLGMAFLSGMCGAARPRPEFEPESDRGEGVVDGSQGCFGESMVIMDMDGIPTRERPGDTPKVLPGEDIDLSNVPDETRSPDPAQATPIRGGEGTKLYGADATDIVTASVEACTIACTTTQGAGQHDDDADLNSSEGAPPSNLNFTAGRVHFVEGGREKNGRLYVSGLDEPQQDEKEADEGGDAEDSSSWGRPGGREEVARILSERFLAGGEEGVDYRAVDDDERLDDLEQLARDEEDHWFRSEGD